MEQKDQYIYRDGRYLKISGSGSEGLVKTTWSDLKSLRDQGKLVAGQQYRITDYNCTTTQFDTQSAGHQFDIIVTADDEKTLNENARAIKHNIVDNGLIIQEGKFTCTPTEEMIKYAQYIDTEEDTGGEGLYLRTWNDYFDSIGYLENGTPVMYLNSEGFEGIVNEYTDYWKYVGIYNYKGIDYDRWAHMSTNWNIEGYVHVTDGSDGQAAGRYILTRKNNNIDYFKNCKLESWQLKYSLDNDTSRFAWADEENGKGVIYYMKDEWNNECPYDFKNIQFKRYKVTDTTEDGMLSWLDGKYLGYLETIHGLKIEDEEDFIWCYTFNKLMLPENDCSDYSIKPLELTIDEANDMYNSFTKGCRNNVIKENYAVVEIDEENATSMLSLNNIVISNDYDTEADPIVDGIHSDMFDNYVDSNCRDFTLLNADKNRFGPECYSIVGNTYESVFGDNCYYITFSDTCYYNTFGSNCGSSTFSSGCHSNTFGSGCRSNRFGDYCSSNTFGDNCESNILGDHCESNTFGSDCRYNRFDSRCDSNRFGVGCYYNTFGESCVSNTFGSNCDSNTFGDHCDSNTLLNNIDHTATDEYAEWNIFENGVSYVDLTADESGSPDNQLQNITIRQGVCGTSGNHKVIEETRGLTHDVTYRAANAEDKTI